MTYSFARVSAVVGMRVKDFYVQRGLRLRMVDQCLNSWLLGVVEELAQRP